MHYVILWGIERRRPFVEGMLASREVRPTRRHLRSTRRRDTPEVIRTACAACEGDRYSDGEDRLRVGPPAPLVRQSVPTGLPFLMPRLFTGYAITFDCRHQRVGHLLKNRLGVGSAALRAAGRAPRSSAPRTGSSTPGWRPWIGQGGP